MVKVGNIWYSYEFCKILEGNKTPGSKSAIMDVTSMSCRKFNS